MVGQTFPRIAVLAALIVGGPSTATAESDRLERIEGEIAAQGSLDEAGVATRMPALTGLIRDYFRAQRSALAAGGVLDPALRAPGDSPVAFERRIARNLRAWHPVASLLFLETMFAEGPEGTYALMLDLDGANVESAIEQRVRDLALHAQRGGSAEPDLRLIRSHVDREIDRLWDGLSAVVEDHAVRILRENLQRAAGVCGAATGAGSIATCVGPREPTFDAVGRVAELLTTIFEHKDGSALVRRIREYEESAALAAALFDTATRVLSHPQLSHLEKQKDFERLLDMLVLLQTAPAADHLILLFDGFDDYAEFRGVREGRLDEILIARTVAFIGRSLLDDPDQALGLDLVDHLTRLILTRLELRFPELRPPRVIEALDLLRRLHPLINVAYFERFYRDFHALDPAGYEAVIFQLTDILVEYAEHGSFLRQPQIPGQTPVADDPGMQQKVMEVLRWYNLALARMPTLPDIEIDYMADEQRATLERIYRYFELRGGAIWELRCEDPRLIETMLILITRIAHAARPEDLEEYVLLPLTKVESVDRRLRNPREPYLTSSMHEAISFLWMLIGEDEHRRFMRELLMEERGF